MGFSWPWKIATPWKTPWIPHFELMAFSWPWKTCAIFHGPLNISYSGENHGFSMALKSSNTMKNPMNLPWIPHFKLMAFSWPWKTPLKIRPFMAGFSWNFHGVFKTMSFFMALKYSIFRGFSWDFHGLFMVQKPWKSHEN